MEDRPAPPPGVVIAPPLWTISAEHNAEHMARVQHRHRAEAIVADLVTKHPPPYFADPVTGGARGMLALAQSKGMTAQLYATLDSCVVEGYSLEAGVGFRAVWERGRAKPGAGTWYEREHRWGMMHDERPGPDAKVERRVKGKVTLVAHPNRMPHGLDRDHLAYLGGPRGVSIGITEVTARLKALTPAPVE